MRRVKASSRRLLVRGSGVSPDCHVDEIGTNTRPGLIREAFEPQKQHTYPNMALHQRDDKADEKTAHDIAEVNEVPELVTSEYADQAYLNASKSTRFFRSSLFQMFMFGA